MKNFTTLLIMFVLATLSTHAQSVTGKWKTTDDKTGEDKSIVEIYEKDGKIYGKIIEILNPDKKDAKCTDCKGADKDKPINGMVIIRGLSKDGDSWSDGKILDPNKGKTYRCTIKLHEKNKNKLDVRGYIGVSLVGRTQTWTRVP